MIETRHLVLLATLDDVGSLNAAARKLHLTPSALSQQLKELEERLGGPLFRRQWRRLVVTAAGRRLTNTAHAVLGELERAAQETQNLLNGVNGTIHLTTVCHQSYRWLPALLKHFADEWPDVEVTVVSDASSAPSEWLLERRLDVALVAGEMKHDPRLRITPLFRDELVALVGREHPWSSLRKIDVRAFAGEHIWTDEGALRPDTPLGRALAEAGGIRPRKVTIVPMTGVVPIEMARANLGITVFPGWTVEPALGSGDLHAVRIGPRGLWLEWAIAMRAEPPLAAFIEALRSFHPRAKARPSGSPSTAKRRKSRARQAS